MKDVVERQENYLYLNLRIVVEGHRDKPKIGIEAIKGQVGSVKNGIIAGEKMSAGLSVFFLLKR